MTPRKKQELDQSAAEMKEALPMAWWALYSGCLEKGFDGRQAMDLVRAWIFGNCGNPIFVSSVPPSKELDDGDDS